MHMPVHRLCEYTAHRAVSDQPSVDEQCGACERIDACEQCAANDPKRSAKPLGDHVEISFAAHGPTDSKWKM